MRDHLCGEQIHKIISMKGSKRNEDSAQHNGHERLPQLRFATPEEVAQCVYSVLENTYINGSIINVDGGYCFQ